VNKRVFDASALLALLNAEPGAEQVAEMLLAGSCVLLSVNLAEVLTRLADWQVPLVEANARLDALNLRIVPFDRVLAQRTAELRQPTRHLGLSLGDRACLALAQSLQATVITADRPWLKLELGIAIECIRD
jgi:PIN domain nuclease of toxin-antitoxin system